MYDRERAVAEIVITWTWKQHAETIMKRTFYNYNFICLYQTILIRQQVIITKSQLVLNKNFSYKT